MNTVFMCSIIALLLELMYAIVVTCRKSKNGGVTYDFIYVFILTLCAIIASGMYLLIMEYFKVCFVITSIVPFALLRLHDAIDLKQFNEPELNTIQDYINEANQSHDFTRAFSYITRLMRTKGMSMNNLSERVKTFMCNNFHIPTINDNNLIRDNVDDREDCVQDEEENENTYFAPI
jgi:hypothetical protein